MSVCVCWGDGLELAEAKSLPVQAVDRLLLETIRWERFLGKSRRVEGSLLKAK